MARCPTRAVWDNNLWKIALLLLLRLLLLRLLLLLRRVAAGSHFVGGWVVRKCQGQSTTHVACGPGHS